MARPFPVPITLGEEDRQLLLGWSRRPKTAQALALRARIILAAAEGKNNTVISSEVGATTMTVAKWRGRFARCGVEGLHDEPRPGAVRTVTDAHVERVIATTLESTRSDATHWSTRRLAAQLGMSQSAISRIWRAFGLQPHKSEAFKLSRDPLFIDKVRDVVGLYLAPPDHALVLCVDEKPQIQATEGTTPVLPMRPGQPEQHSHDYVRHGTRDLFAALDIRAGTVIAELRHRHRSVEFRKFLDAVDQNTPAELDLHLILDNSSIHKTALIQRWLLRHPRVHLHFTPTSASWLNLVECWFALLTRRQLARGSFRSTRALEQAIKRYVAETQVREVMSADPSCCTPDSDLDEVERIMAERKVRRVPVIDGQGCCVGMVAQADLARADQESHRDVRRTVEQISEPTNSSRSNAQAGVRPA